MVYLAAFGPVNDGTPMNLYGFRGGGGRIVDRRPSFGGLAPLATPPLFGAAATWPAFSRGPACVSAPPGLPGGTIVRATAAAVLAGGRAALATTLAPPVEATFTSPDFVRADALAGTFRISKLFCFVAPRLFCGLPRALVFGAAFWRGFSRFDERFLDFSFLRAKA